MKKNRADIYQIIDREQRRLRVKRRWLMVRLLFEISVLAAFLYWVLG